MALVTVFKSYFLLFSVFIAVKEYVCMCVLQYCLLFYWRPQYRCGIIKSNDYFFFIVYNCRSHQCPVTFTVGIVRVIVWLITDVFLVISVSVFPFPPESIIFDISMVIVLMERCRLSVVVLVPPIVLMRVADIAVPQWSIHFVVSC